ncbi:methyl-accepting chemotaxis protein [Rhizobium sp. SSA_523]|uniref:methyl-accepting chemotaxis protein n=1 Tax=Rhizobium sp. SSA_523 TaxID=2952477 RepID=UPI0020908E89|nr:methyl-accepting chemotaxis protein [Rhizobium sp. SSA_523]MCO5731855.1 methyl-accepting chemotaxis protein [Rhizobium sp. SSA_523]WKC22784.1 methyl-accepting chemotaxis protein [Rhizobium sp. SSA_523]
MKIAVLSGICVLTAVGGLLGYGIVAASNSQTYVSTNMTSLSRDMTIKSLTNAALAQARTIQGNLNEAFDAARITARSFEAMAKSDAIAADQRRAQFNAILLNVLKDNPQFNGTYSAWEPNALDGKDETYRNKASAGSDATGRFLPYWTRAADGKIDIQPLVEYDSHALHPNGVVKGGWYIGPQTGQGESILDPLPYIVQGKNVYLATMSVPITIDGRFAGVAGADFDLSFVQRLASEVKSGLFNGKASVTILSYKGLVVASSERPDLVGEPMERLDPSLKDLLPSIQSGKRDATESGALFRALAPITLGRTKTPWSVLIEVPADVAMAQASALDASLSSRNVQDAWLQAAVGLAVLLAGAGAMWLVSRSISQPIAAMTAAMQRLADGDLQADVPGIGRLDEIGQMASAVQIFKENGQRARRLEEEAGHNREMSEQERNRTAAAERKRSDEMMHATSSLAHGLKQVAAGDLTFSFREPFAADFEGLRSDFNAAVEQLRSAMGLVATTTAAIDSGSRELSQGANDLSKRTEQQAAALEETAAALDEITANVTNSTKRTEEARGVATRATQAADQSADVVSQAELAMARIEDSSQQISNIISVIDEIAFQTNLLALNAGVEAARAGDAGKGFAVVAQEVRELAQRAATAAREIKGLIQNSSVEVESGVKLVRNAGDALKTIGQFIVEINGHMDSIATSSREQSTGLAEVNQAVNAMDQTTQQNAAMVEQSTAASSALANEAAKLRDLVDQFQLGSASGAAQSLRHVARTMAGQAERSAPQAGARRLAATGTGPAHQQEWAEF